MFEGWEVLECLVSCSLESKNLNKRCFYYFIIILLFIFYGTETDHVRMERLRVKLRYAGKLVLDNVGRFNSLCLYWSTDVVVELLSFSPAHIDVRVKN